MNDKFLIGELAKIFNISTDTLRHYDKKGLLKPIKDDQNKYRYYDIQSMFKLSRILFLKNLGISLSEIEDYMNNKKTDNLLHLLHKKDEELDVKIQQMLNLKQKIQTKLRLLDQAKTKLNSIYISNIPKRYGVFLKTFGLQDDYEVKEAFKRSEHFLKMSSWLIEGQIYTSIPREDMEDGIFNQYSYFIQVNPMDDKIEKQLEVLPEAQYACMTVVGPYEDLVIHYRTLVDWIHDNNYKIIGSSIENNIVDSDYSESADEFLTEIQIPIK